MCIRSRVFFLQVGRACGPRLLAPDVKHVPAKAEIGGFLILQRHLRPYFKEDADSGKALKGQNRTAQGNALGNHVIPAKAGIQSPERAK